MRKAEALILLLLVFGMLSNAHALTGGKIYGKLTAKDSSALRSIKIALSSTENNKTTLLAETTADENGSYTFENLEANRSYTVSLNYKGIEYSSNVTLRDSEKAEINFNLFEITQEDKGTEIEMHHIIIVPKEGILDVTEYLFYKNAGEEIINTTKLYITLPIERKATITSLMECCFTQFSDYATFDPMQPLKPGDMSEVALNYKIPVNSSESMFERKIRYPTKEFFILAAQRNSTSIEAIEQVLPQGETLIEGESYKVFYAQNLVKESVPKIRFANLKIMKLVPEISAGKDEKTRIRNMLVITGVFLILVGGFYTYRKFKEEKS